MRHDVTVREPVPGTPPPAPDDRIGTILERLEAVYGVPDWTPRNDPLDELVACILSQNTSDTNSFRAFEQLKKRYPTMQQVMDAPVPELVATIRTGGLAETKAPRIQNVLHSLLEERGKLSLDFLYAMSDADARAWLRSLPGVGPKTAGIVLCFAMGRPVLPVDTHVFRVAWRLGLIDKKIGEARAHDALQAQILPAQTFRFHVALITHGREVCKAITPLCSLCPLTDLCPTYPKLQALARERAALETPIVEPSVEN
jgi:endonuclease-3